MGSTSLSRLLLAALFLGLTLGGLALLFSTFVVYDDEGYVLLSLRNYSEHGDLYGAVYSQYGPFFYVFHDLLQRLPGVEWTHTSMRLLTLVHWMGASALCSALVWQQTRSAAAAGATLTATFSHLWMMVREPGHPGGLITLLVALAAWTGAQRWALHGRVAACLLGALGAALALVKINVGGFLLVATLAFGVAHAAHPVVRRVAGAAMVVLLLVLPWLLMRPLLAHTWVQTYALVASLAALGAWVAATRAAQPIVTRRMLVSWLAGGAVVTVLTLCIVLLRGSSAGELLDGILLGPLRHPSVNVYAVQWLPGVRLVALAGLVVTLLAARRSSPPGVEAVVIILRVLAALGVAASLLQQLPIDSLTCALSYGVSLAGVAAVPLRRDGVAPDASSARAWLALLLVLQFLHAFPVAVSQVGWGTFLWMPLLALSMNDAWRALATSTREAWRRVPAVAALVACSFSVVVTGRLLESCWQGLRHGELLRLPGAEHVRTSDPLAFALRILFENARAHAGLLFSLPGMFSFNLWTGLPTPTLANATFWFSLLSEEEQQQIVSSLEADPRAMLIVDTPALEYMTQEGLIKPTSLVSYLRRELEPAFQVGRYSVWVKRGRSIAPLSTGWLFVPPGKKRRLQLVVDSPGTPVARVELWAIGGPERVLRRTLTETDAPMEVTPLDASGAALTQPRVQPWSAPLEAGIVRITLRFDGESPAQGDQLVAFLLDTEGERVAEVRIVQARVAR